MEINKECIICFEDKKNLNKNTYCECNYNICSECYNKWNEQNDPDLICPICHTQYGMIIKYNPVFENKIIYKKEEEILFFKNKSRKICLVASIIGFFIIFGIGIKEIFNL